MEPYNNSNNNTNFANFNNQSAMNQMTQYMNSSENSLYNQNIDSTWKNMQNPSLNEINFNDRSNILSLINLPIIVPYHAEHPLINCKTPGRISEKYNFWQCDSCKSQYSYDVPTFFCTACDFDICQKCILSLGAFWIIIYNYNLGNLSEAKIDEESSYTMKHLNKKIHHHPTIKIIREPSYYENKIRCNLCLKEIQKDENFYFCSLCNYSVCINCYNSKGQEKFVENPEYY